MSVVCVSWDGDLNEKEEKILNLVFDLLARAEEMSEEEIEKQTAEIERLSAEK